jgi:hypothetical protein
MAIDPRHAAVTGRTHATSKARLVCVYSLTETQRAGFSAACRWPQRAAGDAHLRGARRCLLSCAHACHHTTTTHPPATAAAGRPAMAPPRKRAALRLLEFVVTHSAPIRRASARTRRRKACGGHLPCCATSQCARLCARPGGRLGVALPGAQHVHRRECDARGCAAAGGCALLVARAEPPALQAPLLRVSAMATPRMRWRRCRRQSQPPQLRHALAGSHTRACVALA